MLGAQRCSHHVAMHVLYRRPQIVVGSAPDALDDMMWLIPHSGPKRQ